MFNLNLDIKNILQNNVVKIIISIVWGLGLATLFQRICKERNCIIMKGPNPNTIKNQMFKYNNKCYIYHPELSKCAPGHKIYNISA